MHMTKNKIVSIAIAILLTISMSASMILLPTASAHTPAWGIPTFAHIQAVTNPVGIGQKASIYLFLTPTYADEAITNGYRFHNYGLTITAPNGQVSTVNFSTVIDTTSNQGYSFVPDQVGTYQLLFQFPGQNVNDYDHLNNSAYTGDTYLPSSANCTLTVQQDPIYAFPDSYPLPTQYWTRPIYGENPYWFVIASNWLGTGAPGYGGSNGPNARQFAADAVGSLTAHIMWTKPIQSGGVVGGNNFVIPGDTWFEGTAYSQRFINPIIVGGRIFYQSPNSVTGTGGPENCVDLRTGQLIWSRTDVPALSFAYIHDLQTPDFHGVYPALLFTSNLARAFDPENGNNVFNVTGADSGTQVIGPNGEIIKYSFFNNGTGGTSDYYLREWNSSLMWNVWVSMGGITLLTTSTTTWAWSNTTTYVNNVLTNTGQNVTTTSVAANGGASRLYENLSQSAAQNQTIPWRNTMTTTPSIIRAFYNDVLLCMNGSYPALGTVGGSKPYTYFAVDINRTHTTFGQVLWWNNVNPPANNITTVSFAGADESGYFCESYRQTSQFVCYNLKTGAQLWVGDPQPALDYYGSNGPGTLADVIAYGHIYSSAYAGTLFCYDMATGKVLWTYGNGGAGNSTNSGFVVPGPYPTFINAIGNGIIYLITSEHTFETPVYKGALQRAVNATDGTEIYTISCAQGEFSGPGLAIADGFTVFLNSYDQQIYSLGQGPSKTTVTAPNAALSFGQSVVIRGTVTDISAGTQLDQQAADFPNGVPVCSDASIREWMGYVYQQKPLPTNFTGVPVTIDVLDSNGNYRNIGTATTDATGSYSLTWTPDIPGTYTVVANFAGTKGYWPSSTETSFAVDNAPIATTAPTAVPLTAADMYFVPAIAGLFVLIIIVAIVLALLMLRKRP